MRTCEQRAIFAHVPDGEPEGTSKPESWAELATAWGYAQCLARKAWVRELWAFFNDYLWEQHEFTTNVSSPDLSAPLQRLYRNASSCACTLITR